MRKRNAILENRTAYYSWFFLVFIIETFFVFAAMSASYTLMIIFMLCSIGLSAFTYIVGNKKTIYIDQFVLLLFVFLVYVSIGMVLAKSYTDLFFYWTSFLVVVLSYRFRGIFETDRLWRLLRTLGLIFAIGVYLQWIFTDIFMNWYYPLFGAEYQVSIRRQVVRNQMYPGWTSQTFATSINLMMGIFAAWLLYGKQKNKKYLFQLVFMMGAFLLTGKRGPFVFLIVALFGCELLLTKGLRLKMRKLSRYFVFAAVIIVGIILFSSTDGSSTGNVIVRLLESFGDNEDISNGRYELWRLAIRMFLDSPVFGYGWDTYQVLSYDLVGKNMQAHNVYLQLLCETGIIGLLLYVVMALNCIVHTIKAYKVAIARGLLNTSTALKFSILVQVFISLYAFTGNTLYDYNVLVLYFFSFAIYLAAKNTIREKAESASIEQKARVIRRSFT